MAQRLAFILNREIDQRGRSAKSRGARAGFKIVGAGGASERHIQMGVHVDAAGNDDAVLRVENVGGVFDGQILARSRRFVPFVMPMSACVSIRRGNNRAVANDRVESHGSPSGALAAEFGILGYRGKVGKRRTRSVEFKVMRSFAARPQIRAPDALVAVLECRVKSGPEARWKMIHRVVRFRSNRTEVSECPFVRHRRS